VKKESERFRRKKGRTEASPLAFKVLRGKKGASSPVHFKGTVGEQAFPVSTI